MENQKRTKKMLRSQINDSVREAISSLKLPEPTKKINKLIDQNSKKLAVAFAEVLKKENKQKKKNEKLLKAAVNGDGRKRSKRVSEKIEIAHPVKL